MLHQPRPAAAPQARQGRGRGVLVLRQAGRAGLRLVAGAGVFICAECVGLCTEILAQDPPGTAWEAGHRNLAVPFAGALSAHVAGRLDRVVRAPEQPRSNHRDKTDT